MSKEIQQFNQAVNEVLSSSLESLKTFSKKQNISKGEILNETFKVKARTQILNAVGKKIQMEKLIDSKNIIEINPEKKKGLLNFRKK